ncbi:LPXTG cell wall anchor domain-containing protein [Lonsdalea quercina]|uniref:LPXTG cell wall anchor domain-containing protein n=1 Tax=Lonsdalea quercina TaxID=71657 RepID=UPI0039770249
MSLPNTNDWNTILSTLALALSLVSFWFSRRSWLQSNRPIVTAAVETRAGGSKAIAYNLAISNTGNRPGINIRIHARENDIETCVAEWVKDNKDSNTIYTGVMRCFSNNGEIPLLLNGKTMTNSFGYTQGDQETFWINGASLPIKIEYYDLDGRRYQSKQTIRIKDSACFAGGIWSPSRILPVILCNCHRIKGDRSGGHRTG